MEQEIKTAKRSWFQTLTFSPVLLAGVHMEAEKAAMKSQAPFEVLLERAAYSHVQRYFKRLRKDNCEFRYVAIFERGGQYGREHYHLLIHETGKRPIRGVDDLERQWLPSISQPRLVKEDEFGGLRLANYLCKYLTKSLETRPRASRDYGKV